MRARTLGEMLANFAEEKFVLISGPRQVGKTTLARAWLDSFSGRYLNWDDPDDRKTILDRSFLAEPELHALVLDEFHKHARWKAWLKGAYDKYADVLRVVVTGSAKLETFQRTGDSLFGRYEHLRLHPFSIGELCHATLPDPPDDWLDLATGKPAASAWDQLCRRSGFPEPFLRDDDRQQRRWSRSHKSLLVREDLRELTEVRMLSLVEHLAALLPARVGSPLSLNSLRVELEVAHATIASWVDALERLYYCFRLRPFHKRIARSLKKEQKLYLWDWTELTAHGALFENVVACQLLKACHVWTDIGAGDFELCYWKDREHHEVDFVVLERGEPVCFIEAKHADTSPSSALERLGSFYPHVPLVQLVNQRGVDRRRGRLRVIDAMTYLSGLP